MAGLVDSQAPPGSVDLVKIIHNPIFSDLQATLASECSQQSVPYTLVQERGTDQQRDYVGNDHSIDLVVEDATLQAEFRQLSALNNRKVSELENFYNTQCAAMLTQRCDAVSKAQGSGRTAESAAAEMRCVNEYFDRQQRHLVMRVSKSLQLLKCTLPMELAQPGGATKKNKSRNLDRKAVQIMSDWYDRHEDNPYPTDEEKLDMAEKGSLNVAQVKAWFANKRNRSLNTRPKRQKMKMAKELVNICEKLTTPHQPEVKSYSQNAPLAFCDKPGMIQYNNLMEDLSFLVQNSHTAQHPYPTLQVT